MRTDRGQLSLRFTIAHCVQMIRQTAATDDHRKPEFVIFPRMVKTEKIRTKKSTIWLDEEGILRLMPNEGEELDLEEVKECFEIYRRLGCHEHKVLQLIESNGAMSLSAEARDYAAKHVNECFIAAAVVSNSLAIRFIVNFFNSFYKSRVPLRMFKTEEEALRWLRTFKKQ